MANFLSTDDVLYIHANQIELYGGDPGVRDRGGLESDVAQPRARLGGEYFHSDLAEMAAFFRTHAV